MDICLDKRSPIPLGDQLQAQIRVLIAAGTLVSGDLLPTAQSLAATTHTNYNTVAAAYRALEAQGYVVQRRRAGTRVAAEPPTDVRELNAVHLGAEVAARAEALGLSPNETLRFIGAQAALRAYAPTLPVAVVAADPLTAAAFAEQAKALFGERRRYVPVTLQSYHPRHYAATLVSPALLNSLTQSDPLPFPHTPMWPSSYDFPAGAD